MQDQSSAARQDLEKLSVRRQVTDDDITVIVPTLGRPVLQATLLALAENTVLPAGVVIIDQSKDAPIDAWCVCLKSRGVRVQQVRAEPLGPSNARNRALEQVTTRYFASIDDDCTPAEDWLAAMAHRLRANPSAIVSGRVEAPKGALAPSTKESEVEEIVRAPFYGDPLLTGNFGAALIVAASIGVFDEELRTAEDNDWAHRALRLGIPIIYAPEARVIHNNPLAPDQMAKVEQTYAHGQGRFMAKHMARGDVFVAARFIRETARLSRAYLRSVFIGDRSAQSRAARRLGSFLGGALGAPLGRSATHRNVPRLPLT